MIDRTHRLSVRRQAKALGISRGSVYHLARPTSEADLKLMRRIDGLHLEHPFAGSRMLRDLLRGEGHDVGRRHVSTLMKKMAIAALYRAGEATAVSARPGRSDLLEERDIASPAPRARSLARRCLVLGAAAPASMA